MVVGPVATVDNTISVFPNSTARFILPEDLTQGDFHEMDSYHYRLV